MIKQDAAKYTDFCHHIEGYGGFSPWLDEYDPLTETGFAFVHGGSEDNGQFGLGDIDLNFGTTEFSYKDILEKVKKYRDECKGQMDPDFPEECEYVEELDELVRAITDWCSENESKKSEATDGLDSLVGIKNCKELQKKIDSLGFTFVESGDYAGHIWGYAVYKSPNGEYIQYDFNGTNDNCRNVKVFKSKQDFIDAEGYDPEKSESAKNKKSEGVEALKDKVVSDGTLKPEDLIPKFLNALKHDETAHSKFLKDFPEVLEIQSWDDVDDETKSMLVDELTDALNGIAPDGYFFGASDGDGACFGFWKVDPDESKKSEGANTLPTKEEIKRVVDGLRKDKVFSRRYSVSDSALYGAIDPEWSPFISITDKKTGKTYAEILFDGDGKVRIIGFPYSPIEGDSSDIDWILKVLRNKKPAESKKSEALTKDTVVVGTLDNSNKKWIERTLQQIKKKFPNVESDAFGCTITVRGKLADVAKVLNAYPKGIPSWCSDKGGDFLPNAAGDNLDDNEVSKVLSESKKNEGVGGKIKMGIDYNMFMRMCASAAYLDDNEDYWDALWEYYSEMGEIEDACEFFDNLFQYTSWCDEDEVYDEYLDDSYKDGTKSKAECIDAAVDAGDLDVFKTDKGYLVIQ